MAGTPKPIDPRGPRFNQAVLATGLLAGFLFDWRRSCPIFAVVLLLGAAFGPRYGPFLRLYAEVVKPRLSPADGAGGPSSAPLRGRRGRAVPHRGTVAFLAGASTLGWVLALVVAVLAGLSATTGMCVGCEIWLFAARRRGVALTGWPARDPPAAAGRRRPRLRRAPGRPPLPAVAGRRFDRAPATPLIPLSIRAGAERTWVIFTTPYCATCGPIEARLRASDPGANVVRIDATEQPQLSDAFKVRSAPTVLLADGDGRVQARLVGAEAFERYVRNPA